MTSSQSYSIQFIKKINLANNTYSFYFRRPANFEFTAGQYIRMTLPFTAKDGRGSSRFFTISSPPTEKQYLIITTKIIKSDFKKYLLVLKNNQFISVFGPMGQFLLDDNDNKEHIFLAGGLGITPFFSMISDNAEKQLQHPITLFAFFRNSDDIIFRNELILISKKNHFITIEYANNIYDFQVPILKKYVNKLNKCKYYIVGPPEMVEETQKILINLKISSENIKTEQFTGY